MKKEHSLQFKLQMPFFQAIARKNDPFSVTWVATLKPAFRKCVAIGGIVKQDGKSDNSTSYLPV
jgi:hypothetical protein